MIPKQFLLYAMLTTIIISLGCEKKDNNDSPDISDYPEDAIHMAVAGNNPDAIKYFVEAGFDINEKDKDGHTPLTHGLRICGTEDSTIDYLLTLGANPNISEDDGETPLELAVSLGQNEKAISLLVHGASLQRSKDKEGTLIHVAISRCNDDVIKKMLECGGEKLLYTKGDTIPNFPVEKAIDISGDIDINGKEVATILLDHMDLNYADEHGNNLLHRECIRGDLELIQMLLERGMDVNAKNNQGLTPLRLAKNYNNGSKEEEIVTLLLSCGAKESKETSKETREDSEPQFTDQDFLSELKQKSDLNERDHDLRTPLHYALYREYLEAVIYLLSKNVDVNVQDKQGITPLHLSMKMGNIEIIKKLLDSKARLDIIGFGGTPLNWAITMNESMANKHEVIELLIDKGAPINGVGKSKPPIFDAVGMRDNKALKILIQAGADVNMFNFGNETPLERAIYNENIEGFEILLKNGADINKKDKYGRSAFDTLNRRPDSVKEQFLQVIHDFKIGSK